MIEIRIAISLGLLVAGLFLFSFFDESFEWGFSDGIFKKMGYILVTAAAGIVICLFVATWRYV